MSTDAILRKFRLCECSFDESFGIVRSIIFYLHSSRFVSEIILIQQWEAKCLGICFKFVKEIPV